MQGGKASLKIVKHHNYGNRMQNLSGYYVKHKPALAIVSLYFSQFPQARLEESTIACNYSILIYSRYASLHRLH